MKKIILLCGIIFCCITVMAQSPSLQVSTICDSPGSTATASVINLPTGVTVTWSVNARLTIIGPTTGSSTTVEYNPSGGTIGPMRVTATLSNGTVLGKILEIDCD